MRKTYSGVFFSRIIPPRGLRSAKADVTPGNVRLYYVTVEELDVRLGSWHAFLFPSPPLDPAAEGSELLP